MNPKHVDMTNHAKWCCFEFGPVSVTCHLPQTGFSPGDSITLNMYVENESTKKIVYVLHCTENDLLIR